MSNALTYKGFSARVEFDAEDRIFVGRIAGIRDVICFHARNVNDIERAFKESIRNYMNACTQLDSTRKSIPNEVVGAVFTKGHSVARAWREHLGMTQAQLAKKMQLTQAAVAQFETPGAKLRRASRDKIAKAMGIASELLDW
jgi:ribosome-binding protein aMBF1 (putative translation factor)